MSLFCQDRFFAEAGITVVTCDDKELVLEWQRSGDRERFVPLAGMTFEQASAQGRDVILRDGRVYEFAGEVPRQARPEAAAQ